LLGCAAKAPIYSSHPPIPLKNDTLNDERFRILERVIRNRDLITSVESAPGVGKTILCNAVIENILLEEPKSTILVCCSSNKATDHLALSISQYLSKKQGDFKFVRVYARDQEPLADPQLTPISLHHSINIASLDQDSPLFVTADQCNKIKNQISQLSFLCNHFTAKEKQLNFDNTSSLVKQHKNLKHELSQQYLHDILHP
ncbi:MAG: hypothetical protein GY816_10620, partial [Cytophagales bacterium]|nr:hypothetical protein [Cytophagales bacterium]